MRFLIVALSLSLPGCSMFSGPPQPAFTPVKPEEVFSIPGQQPINTMSLSESGEVIAVGCHDGTSSLLDRHGRVLTSWSSAENSPISLCAINERMGLIVSASSSHDVSVLQSGDYHVVANQRLGYPATTVAYHPTKPFAVIGTHELHAREGLVRRYDIVKKQWDEILDTKMVAGVKVEIPGVYGLEFSPDGTRLAVLTRSTLLVLDWESMRIVHNVAQLGTDIYQSLHFTHDGTSLVLSDHNRKFWVYDTVTWACRETVIPDNKQMKQFCVSRDDKYLCVAISTPEDSKYRGCWAVYSFPDIKPLAYVPAHVRAVRHIFADPKVGKILTGGGDGKIMVWSIDDVLKLNN